MSQRQQIWGMANWGSGHRLMAAIPRWPKGFGEHLGRGTSTARCNRLWSSETWQSIVQCGSGTTRYRTIPLPKKAGSFITVPSLALRHTQTLPLHARGAQSSQKMKILLGNKATTAEAGTQQGSVLLEASPKQAAS